MNTDSLWAGLDLGLRQSHLCIVDNEGLVVHEDICETSFDGISNALSEEHRANLALIATEAGADTYVVRKLRDARLPVAVFEARKASRFLAVRRNKSDASDAHGLADLARLGRHTVSQVHMKSLDCQQLRSQLVMRHKLVRLRVATENALKSRLALYGRHLGSQYSPQLLRARALAQIAQLKTEEGVDLQEDLEPLIDVSASLRRYIKTLDARLNKLAQEHPVCRALMGVTGVGPICALSFYSSVEEASRFKRTADIASYLGLNPRRYQSGEVSYTRGITKTGNTMTRTHLVHAAMMFSRLGPDSELKTWATSLRARIGKRRANVAVARKLAVILLTMWKTGTAFKPFPTRCAPTG
jgi:transposase